MRIGITGLLLQVVIFISFINTATAGQFMLNPKVGLRNWGNDVYVIQGNTITFDDALRPALAIRGSYISDLGLAGSIEIMASSVDATDETAGTQRGVASEASITMMAQYYFLRDKKFSPYIGLGAGTHGIEITDSNTNASLSGYSSQVHVGGIINVGKRIGINLEYKYYKFNVDDDNGAEMKSSATWFGTGVTWRF